MRLEISYTKSEQNRLTKVLTNTVQIEGMLRNGCSVLSPVITVQRGQGITQFNYAYIPPFNRYYFITDIVSIRNDLWELHMSVDPLMSFADSIKKVVAVAERSENVFNLYLPDNEWKSDVRSHVQYREIGGFKAFTPIIVVAGSVNETQSG